MGADMGPDFEKLRDAAAVLDGIPEERYVSKLDTVFAGKNAGTAECGALACGIGWLAIHGGFGFSTSGLYSFSYSWSASRAFRISRADAQTLFSTRMLSKYDYGFRGTDKALLRHRIVSFLKEHGQPVKEGK